MGTSALTQGPLSRNPLCAPTMASGFYIDFCACHLSLFLKYKFIYFNWRLITLQYCIGSAIHHTCCHTMNALKSGGKLLRVNFPATMNLLK